MPGTDVRIDLVDEQAALDTIVASLSPPDWSLDTPSPRWTVADQIGHLTFFDTSAALAITDPEAFVAHRNELVAKFTDPVSVDEATLGPFRAMEPAALLAEWRRRRDELARAAHSADSSTRVEWYGPSMSLRSFLTARLMEAWAHGQDIVDTVGATRQPTDRLRHVAQLGVITRGWSYRVRGMEPPDGDLRVELVSPSGDQWTWGDVGTPDVVSGPAEDFCLVVTQRRHLDDTLITTTGGAAREWMEHAQAFAGQPTEGPRPGRKDQTT